MSGIDFSWARSQLDEFLRVADIYRSVLRGEVRVGRNDIDLASDQIVAAFAIAEPILDRITPAWRNDVTAAVGGDRWLPIRDAATRARVLLMRGHEIKKGLGDDAPQISAAELHPWVWESAKSLWQSGHYKQAVQDALIQLNAEAQKKSGRTDISETDLFNQLFSLEPAKTGSPRLHRADPHDSKTFESMQSGARSLAGALYRGIRNPLSHRADHGLTEHEALESLAAISILARWVDEAELVTAEEGAEK